MSKRPFDSEEHASTLLARREIGWVVTTFALVAVILLLFIQNFRLTGQNTDLANNRVMYGVPDERGTFVSVRKRPERVVRSFGEQYVLNLYNWQNEATARINFQAALAQMDARFVGETARALDDKAAQIGADLSSQTFIPTERGTVRETERGYVYAVRGSVVSYVGRTRESQYDLTVTVRMAKVAPSESNPFGLVVVSSEGDA